MSEDLFPREFIEKLKKNIPEAEKQLTLAEKRLVVAKAAGVDTKTLENKIFDLQQRIRKIKAAFRVG